jgi:Short C-terminal domain
VFKRIRELLGGNEDLRGSGLRGTAEVLEVVDTRRNIGLDNSVPSSVYRARLRITLPDAEPYEIQQETTSVPPVGTVAPVWVDPKRSDRVFVDVMALAEEQAAAAQRFAAAAAPPSSPASAGGEADVVAGLERLVALRASGAITDEEFAAAKARLLGGDG